VNYKNIIATHRKSLYIAILGLTWLAGCTSPPSVMPLLRITQGALHSESAQLRQDIPRDGRAIEQVRMSLDDAFAADLRQQEELSVVWVSEAMDVYIAAREALLVHELTLKQERLQREENLDVAANATQRAIDLLEQRDQLLADTSIARLWRLLDDSDR